MSVQHGGSRCLLPVPWNNSRPHSQASYCNRRIPGYDEARRVHNGLIDKRPAIIARCRGTADVADAVKLARSLNLEIAVRGGGHNVGGRGTIDGGMMIDLATMKGIHVHPARRTARAQGGVLWKEFNRETQLHGLATTGGVVGTTGIAGLTLGGGLGWLMPKYGLALDNLLSAEMVMADGSVRRAAADENPDLYLGHPRGRRQLRRCRLARVRAAPGGTDDCRRPGRASAAERAERPPVLSRNLRDAARRDDAGRRPVDRAGRLGEQARWHPCRALRIAGRTARRRWRRSRRSGRRSWTRWARFPIASRTG